MNNNLDFRVDSINQQNLPLKNASLASVTRFGHTISKAITLPRVLFVAAVVASIFTGTVTAFLLIASLPVSPLVAGTVGLVLGTTMLAKTTYDIFSKSQHDNDVNQDHDKTDLRALESDMRRQRIGNHRTDTGGPYREFRGGGHDRHDEYS